VRNNPAPKIRARFFMSDLLSLFSLVQLAFALNRTVVTGQIWRRKLRPDI
jgi:hypothetical protein